MGVDEHFSFLNMKPTAASAVMIALIESGGDYSRYTDI